MKILRNLCLHLARQDGKKWKENHATKVTLYQNQKAKIWDEHWFSLYRLGSNQK